MTPTKSHSSSTRLLHWAMAFIILSMLCLGLSMIQSLAVWQPDALKLHKSFGIIALILVIVRLLNKSISQSPALPADLPTWQQRAAHLTHFGLYTAMLLMPLSGWLMQSADNRSVTLFNWLTLPQLIDPSITAYAFFREMHAIVTWLFLLLIFMHIGAALYHGLIRQDGVLSSMLFRKKPDSHGE